MSFSNNIRRELFVIIDSNALTILSDEAAVINNALLRDQDKRGTPMSVEYLDELSGIFDHDGELNLSLTYAKLLKVWFELGVRVDFFVPTERQVLETIFARLPNS